MLLLQYNQATQSTTLAAGSYAQRISQKDDMREGPTYSGAGWKVTDFGAVGNGIHDDTPAFEEVLKLIEDSGGGRLIVTGDVSSSEKVYMIRPINLTSHMEFFIEAGARILGIAKASAWPIIEPLPSYGQGRDHIGPRHTSLIHGEGLVNVTVLGEDPYRSKIDGNGEYWWKRRKSGNETITRGSLVEFQYSTNIQLASLTLMNSPFWTVHPYDCEYVHIQNVHIQNPLHTPNTDGFDPDSSRHVRIEDSSYVGGDDCISIKSGWDCFGEEYGRPASDIYVRNITCFCNQISLGSENSGGIQDILAEDIYFPATALHGVKIKSGSTRGGYIRNITFRDVYFTGELRNSSIDVDMDLYSHTKGNPSCPANWTPSHEPVVENLWFERWHGEEVNFTGSTMFYFRGISQKSPIANMRLNELNFPFGIWICSNLQNATAESGTVIPWPPCSDIHETIHDFHNYGNIGSFHQKQVHPHFLNTLLMLLVMCVFAKWTITRSSYSTSSVSGMGT